MSGCEGCFQSPQGQNIALENAITKATSDAKENQVSQAIYKEAGEYRNCNAFIAYQLGYPVIKVVSFYSATSS